MTKLKSMFLLLRDRKNGRFAAAGCPVRLMAALDSINGKWGRGTLRTGSVPMTPNWGMRREQMSQSYTTRLDQLWVVKAK
ncbi:hypothetical protein GCM10009085_53840 [Pseudomonas avellanae]|nr:hypothetical protein GCM10009085_53840 [Pseudomonas avellanae]